MNKPALNSISLVYISFPKSNMGRNLNETIHSKFYIFSCMRRLPKIEQPDVERVERIE